MHLTPMPSALLARRLRSRLWCQKQVGASDRGCSMKKAHRHMNLRLTLILLAAFSLVPFDTKADSRKTPDFYTYNKDGSVKTRGVYDTDSKGQVIKFTVFDASGTVKYTEFPYYTNDGRIIRADHMNSSGTLEFAIVYFDDSATKLDSHGKFIEAVPFSQKEFLSKSKQ